MAISIIVFGAVAIAGIVFVGVALDSLRHA